MPWISQDIACHHLVVDPKAQWVAQRGSFQSNEKAEAAVNMEEGLNKACLKDVFPLPSVDKLVENSSSFRLLSFMDAYSEYNQILMFPPD